MRVGETRVVKAGSVGMPFGTTGINWLMLGPGVELRHTPYDLDKAAAVIRATTYPQAKDFIENNLLKTRSEQEILERFSKAELS